MCGRSELRKTQAGPPVSSSQTGGMRQEENTEQEAGDARVGVGGWVEGARGWVVGSLWQSLKREHLNGVWEVNRACQEEGGSKESNPIERRSWAKAWWHERSRCTWGDREKGHMPGGGKTWEGAEGLQKGRWGQLIQGNLCQARDGVMEGAPGVGSIQFAGLP